jgi:O-antigen/teichoic acid export membrane protein
MARHVATLVAGFVTIPILARMLGASRLGYWNLLGTAAFLLGLCDLGLNTATLRAAAGTDPANAKRVARVASLMTFVLSVPAAALCVVWLWSAAEQLPQEQQSDARRAVLIGLSGGVVAAVTQSLRSYAQGQGRIVALAWGRAAGVLVQLALTIGLLLLGHELTAVAVGFAVGAALESALGFRAARDDVHAPGLPTGDQRKEMVRVAGSAMLTNVSVILAIRADVLVLERVTNLATIGAYSVASRLVDQGFTLVKQVSAALVPRLGKRASDRSGSVQLGTMIIGIMAVGPLAATAVAGRPILVLWAGEPIDLPILGVALAWLAGAAMMAAMSEVPSAAISLGDDPIVGARFIAIGSAVNVVLSVAGGYAFGAWAVAASTLAGNSVLALLVWRRSYRSFNWSPIVVLRVWLPIAGSGIVGAVAAALCQSASLHAILAVGVGAVLSVALGAGVLYLLRTPEVP